MSLELKDCGADLDARTYDVTMWVAFKFNGELKRMTITKPREYFIATASPVLPLEWIRQTMRPAIEDEFVARPLQDWESVGDLTA